MALVVTHNSTADGDPLIDGDDWNANHTLTGGGTFRIPQYLNTYSIDAGSTSYTISSLDGNTDGEYFLKGSLVITCTNLDGHIKLNPNNATTGVWGTLHRFHSSGNDYTTTADYWRLSYHGMNGEVVKLTFTLQLFCESGNTKRGVYNANTTIGTSDFIFYRQGVGYLSTDNLTSLVFTQHNCTFGGTIKLYKMVDLTI